MSFAPSTVAHLRKLTLAIFLICVAPESVYATNGLNLIGFGAESTGMGGADIAVARDTSALNTNPAGLTQIKGSALDLSVAAAYSLDVGHTDIYGNNAQVYNHWLPVGDIGYAHALGNGGITIGGGVFVQGGAGSEYHHINTVFGTTDDLSAIFGAAKFSAGLGYQASPKLSVGVSASLVHAAARQKVFPGTSSFNALNPPASFFGFRLDDATANRAGFKVGTLYALNDAVKLAATYTAKTPLTLKDGTLTANMSSIGLGNVTYRNAQITGLGFPQELALGLALQERSTLWSVKLAWLDWAGVMSTSTLTATGADNSLALPVLSQTQNNQWKNQWVMAVGLAHELDAQTTVWAGYNYGRNPIPEQNTNPLLAAISEKHLTLGVAQKLDAFWRISGGLEYQPGAHVTYTNAALPFGPNAEERDRYLAINLMLSRRW